MYICKVCNVYWCEICTLALFVQLFRPKMEEAKEVHKCLRTAAGIFTAIKVFNRLYRNTVDCHVHVTVTCLYKRSYSVYASRVTVSIHWTLHWMNFRDGIIVELTDSNVCHRMNGFLCGSSITKCFTAYTNGW